MPEIVLEKMLHGEVSKAADVGLRSGDEWVAFEAQMDTRADLVCDLIQKDLRAGFAKIVLCVLTPKDVERVQAVVAEIALAPEKFGLRAPIAGLVKIRLLATFLNSGGGKS